MGQRLLLLVHMIKVCQNPDRLSINLPGNFNPFGGPVDNGFDCELVFNDIHSVLDDLQGPCESELEASGNVDGFEPMDSGCDFEPVDHMEPAPEGTPQDTMPGALEDPLQDPYDLMDPFNPMNQFMNPFGPMNPTGMGGPGGP